MVDGALAMEAGVGAGVTVANCAVSCTWVDSALAGEAAGAAATLRPTTVVGLTAV